MDDGTTKSGSSGSYTYADTGSYDVVLTVGSPDSTVSNSPKTKPITISEPELVASGTVTKTTALAVSFESTTDGANTWEWDFGEDTSGDIDKDIESGTFIYSEPGSYTVTLTVTSPKGQTDSCTIPVSFADSPTAYFTVDYNKGSSPLYVRFTDKSTKNSFTNAKIEEWEWLFDYGNQGKEFDDDDDSADTEYIYYSQGTYNPTLTVTDEDENSDTYEYDSIEVVPAADAPKADFEIDEDSSDYGAAPLTVQFNDLSEESVNSESDLDKYYWEFYDEDNDDIDVITSIKKDPKIEFEEAGVYTVRLTVVDDDGVCSTKVKKDIIEVTSTLSATFTASPASGTAPLTVSFSANPGDYNIDRYVWNFGSGEGTGTGKTVSHTYSSAGTYKVTLTVYEGSKSYTTPAKSIAVSKKVATTTKATYVIETTASPTATANLAQLSAGTKIFGIPGTEFFRDEIERFYDFYKEYTSLIAGLFGSGK